MSEEDNRNLVRHLIDARNTHDADKFASFFPEERQPMVKKSFDNVTEAFPDVHITIDEMIAENNKVVCRWTLYGTHRGMYQDIPATGKTVNYTGIDIYTLTDGIITSVIRETDSMVVLKQLGVVDADGKSATL